MSAASGQPRTERPMPGGGFSYTSQNMRISDADRAAVADRLSRHYGDGRLDQAEFNERLDQAMRAKTHADLAGLFADLPEDDLPQPPVQPAPPAPRAVAGRRPRHRIAFLVLVVVLTAAVGQALTRPYVPWLWIGLAVFCVLRFRPRLHRR